jgi:hypothetical protein
VTEEILGRGGRGEGGRFRGRQRRQRKQGRKAKVKIWGSCSDGPWDLITILTFGHNVSYVRNGQEYVSEISGNPSLILLAAHPAYPGRRVV